MDDINKSLPSPHFFDHPGMDALYRVCIALGAEIGVLRNRVSILEEIPPADEIGAQRALIERVFGFLADAQGFSKWRPYQELLAELDLEHRDFIEGES